MSAPLREKLSGPWVWRGPELDPAEWIRTLDAEAIGEIERASAHARDTGKSLEALERDDFPLPGLQRELAGWLAELDRGRGFVLVRGLPVERWGEEFSSLAYYGLGLHLGTPVSQNADGERLGHVRDTGADPNDPSVRLYKTRARQPFHTDGADVIGLLCLREAKRGGESQIASSARVFNELLARRPDLVPRLFEPFHFDRNEEQNEGEPPTFQLPICHYDGERLRTFYVGWYIRDAPRHEGVPALSTAEHELLDLIDAIADDPAIRLDMTFEPGDLQLLKNSVILHARAAYEDHDEPEKKRHLLRLWLTARAGFEDGDDFLRQGIPKKTA